MLEIWPHCNCKLFNCALLETFQCKSWRASPAIHRKVKRHINTSVDVRRAPVTRCLFLVSPHLGTLLGAMVYHDDLAPSVTSRRKEVMTAAISFAEFSSAPWNLTKESKIISRRQLLVISSSRGSPILGGASPTQ